MRLARGARACSSANSTPEKVVAMRSRTRRFAIAIAITITIAALAVPAGVALATPPKDLTPTQLGKGTFTERVKVNTPNIKAKFKRPSDFIVLALVVGPGGDTGWHTHPGPALVIIKEGTFTLYDGDDRKCRPHRYGPGEAFVDEGGGHVHIGRNETRKPVKLLVTFIAPRGAAPSTDADDPGNCRF
jgi:quercetin dioxygenase-like cupin family protein